MWHLNFSTKIFNFIQRNFCLQRFTTHTCFLNFLENPNVFKTFTTRKDNIGASCICFV